MGNERSHAVASGFDFPFTASQVISFTCISDSMVGLGYVLGGNETIEEKNSDVVLTLTQGQKKHSNVLQLIGRLSSGHR